MAGGNDIRGRVRERRLGCDQVHHSSFVCDIACRPYPFAAAPVRPALFLDRRGRLRLAVAASLAGTAAYFGFAPSGDLVRRANCRPVCMPDTVALAARGDEFMG